MRRTASIVLGAVLAAAFLGGIAVTGVTVTMRDSYPTGGEQGEWPAPRSVPPGATVVAVVLGTGGSVVSDALLPYEAFARASGFFVYTVAEQRRPVPLSGGLRAVPEHTFGTAPEPDVVVVPAVVRREAAIEEWLRGRAARGAYVLGVCAGAEVLADTGLLAGRRATSFWQRLGALRRSFPDTAWIAGERFVEDGRIVTTAGVTSGLAGSLRLIELLAGPAEAVRIGQEVSYRDWVPGMSTRIPRQSLAVADLPYALNAAFPWLRPDVGIGLSEGVGEIDVAAAFETYAGASFAARAVPVATHPTVITRHGLLLTAASVHPGSPSSATGPHSLPVAGARPPALPVAVVDSSGVRASSFRSSGVPVTIVRRPDLAVAGLERRGLEPAADDLAVDRLIVPGVDEAGAELTAWAAGRGLDVTVPHAGRRPDEFAFDPLLRDLAEYADRATARTTAKFTEHPAGHLGLTGAAWPWRSTLLGLTALALAAGAGMVPELIRRKVIVKRKRP